MYDEEFLNAFADFYGSFTLEELAERFGLSVIDLVECMEDMIELNRDSLEEEMEYGEQGDECWYGED